MFISFRIMFRPNTISDSKAQTVICIFYSQVSVHDSTAVGLRPPAETGRKHIISVGKM